jgi:anaerobic magnesium-protoporphyrin IX monomethyl ester cyclase
MRILVLQFAPTTRGRPVPRFEPQLAVLLALLERRGHELALEGFARFDLERIKAALARHLPKLIYADISPVCVDAARRTLEYIERHEYLPIVAGGGYASVAPAAALSLPGVQAVAVGEPDASLVTYFERIKDPAVGQVVSGVWLRDERGLAQPDVPELVEDLDSLPFAHRELFGYAATAAVTGQLDVAVGRGSPERVGYTIEARAAALYEGRGEWVRQRSPGNVLAEIAQARERYPTISRVRFLDRGFALADAWLEHFLTVYRTRCGLPYRCHVRLAALGRRLADRLAESGCEFADVDVISASNLIRNEIFGMQLAGEQVEHAFDLLRERDIRTRAIVFAGAPYESEASLSQTHELLRRVRPDVVDVRPYFPWPGSSAWALCQEQGWLHSRGEEQYHQDRPGIDMPACRPEVIRAFIRRLRAELPQSLDRPWWRRWQKSPAAGWEPVFARRRL